MKKNMNYKIKKNIMKKNIKELLSVYKTLSPYGIVPTHIGLGRRPSKYDSKPEEFYTNDCIEEIKYVLEFLADVEKIKTINRSRPSYGLKRIVETYFSRVREHWVYISNGSLIMGALIAGFKIKTFEHNPNAWFNMSEKSIKKYIQE